MPTRALAGLITHVADGRVKPEHRTVFMHAGGLPGLFGHPEQLTQGANAGTAIPVVEPGADRLAAGSYRAPQFRANPTQPDTRRHSKPARMAADLH
ncbi:MAG: hypothetical protein ACRDRS_18615 [Pseudonocardiaceae bacterium]